MTQRCSCAAWRRIPLPMLLLALLLPVSVAAQGGVVAGRVLAEGSLRPLAGVQVVAEGTGIEALTDNNGAFRLEGLQGPQVRLQFQTLGYGSAEQTVEVGTTDLRVTLGERPIELDAVVVTGTAGATQRRALGNAVTTIDADEVRELSAVSDVGGLLNGRAPGVVLTPGTGRVGAGPSINIRGRSTISLSQQPLIYIDGVRVNNEIGSGPEFAGVNAISRLNDLNPSDIESIEIIKGPAAATLYGTEAANGVIQIITKKGAPGAPRFGLTVRQGTSWFADAEDRMPTNYAIHPGTGELLTFNAVRYEAERGRDLWDRGHLQTYVLDMQGGSDRVRYYLSTGYEDQTGVEPGNGLERFTGHVNLSVDATESLDVQSSLNLVKGRTLLGGGTGQGVMLSAIGGHPLFDVLGFPAGPYLGYTPEVYRDVIETSQDLARFTGSVQVNHQPASWFQHRLTLGLDQTGEDNQYLTKFAPEHLAPQFSSEAAARGGLLQEVRNVAYVTADYNGSVTLPVTENLRSASSVGVQYYRRRVDFNSVDADEFPAPGLRTAAAAARVTGSQDYETNATLGMFGQQQFSWRDRLFVTGALRVDNNSAFGEDIEFVTYPKLSAAWVISDEPFWSLEAVDQLRLRAAYGASGQQPDAFAALRTFEPATGAGDLPIVVPQSVGNVDLEPERGEEIEVGFEMGLLDRLGLELTYYNRRVRNAILQRSIAPSTGFSGSQFVNIGEIHNSGLEAQLQLQAISRPDLLWDVMLSYAKARDEITDLGGISAIQLGLPTQLHREGYPIAGFWTREIVSAEVDDTGASVNVMCNDGSGGTVACAEAPPVFLGTPTPVHNGAFATTLTLWGRLQLHGMVDYKGGHKLFDSNLFVRCALLSVCEANVNPQEADPVFLAGARLGGDFSTVSPFIQDGSYARLREVSARYSLPESWAGRMGASGLSVTVAGRNLATWTDFGGMDPESRANITTMVANNQAVLPVMPQFVTSLQLTF